MTATAQLRRPIVGGNWKMNTTRATAVALANAVYEGLHGPKALNGGLQSQVDVVLFPPFPYLIPVDEALGKRPGRPFLGAQNVYCAPEGAYTGEVCISMLQDIGCTHVLIGHSERRHVCGENEDLINKKLRIALDNGMIAILCVGEKLEEREAGRTDEINTRQLRSALQGVPQHQVAKLVIAYEPVWAIGTGRNATPDDAQKAHARIRQELAVLYGDIAKTVPIQYGGSVKAANARELMAMPDVDGALVGGASLKAEEFCEIVRAAAQ